MTDHPAQIVYVTGSEYKRAENAIFVEHATLSDGQPVKEVADFEIRPVEIKETLEISIAKMVLAEAKSAYAALKVPCVVEHAGLVLGEYAKRSEDEQYPGGLTKPMWNALGEKFLDELQGNGRNVVAKAVVGYCDGVRMYTFTGSTPGTLANEIRGERAFYWDTVFVPDEQDDSKNETYAELVTSRGLEYKVCELSQSSRAMVKFLEWFRSEDPPSLWS